MLHFVDHAGNVSVAKALMDSGTFRSLVVLFIAHGGDTEAEPLRSLAPHTHIHTSYSSTRC